MDGYEQHEREEAACERITRRHGGDLFRRINEGNSPSTYMAATAPQAVEMVVSALRFSEDHPLHDHPAGEDDLDAALTLIPATRRSLDYDELLLIDQARARHRTWGQIGAAGGYGDRRQAQRRFRRLCERFPHYDPVCGKAGNTPEQA